MNLKDQCMVTSFTATVHVHLVVHALMHIPDFFLLKLQWFLLCCAFQG